MKRTSLLLVFIVVAAILWMSARPPGIGLERERRQMSEPIGTVAAPEFPAGLQWLNTARPLRLGELRGKVVLLDFWTFCCINCMHVIPDLKRLEKKYPNELVVIGVHSAKFTTEKETENIRQAILRYEIAHPVINDRNMAVWQEYGVHAWPTLALIDPAGKIVGTLSGEDIFDTFDRIIARVIEAFDAKGQLDRRPLDLQLERDRAPATLLSFPGKVLADEASNQLFIADSNHNRIVVVSMADRSVKEVIGSGESGLGDGDFGQATFHHPQGMAYDGKVLYVADTENHAIRLVDFEKRRVATIAGTGQQARRFNVSGAAKETPLNSPWDLVLHDGSLYIAMAGSHQLWRMDLKSGWVSPYAGSGREARDDGPLPEAALAQPSGIAADNRRLYFADSEDSSIRAADLDPKGRVETLVGGDLFDIGDRDGRGLSVRLQHPLGVAYHDGLLYVADTYNNKIKRVSPKHRTAETFLGTGKAGLTDGDKATFDEPGGLSVAAGRLYVADTNNHVIRVADLKTRRVETLQIMAMEKLRPPSRAKFTGETPERPAQAVAPGEAALTISLELPPGYKLNPQAPSAVTVVSSDAKVLNFGGNGEQVFRNPQFPLRIPAKVNEGTTALQADFVLYYCEAEKESLCYFKDVRVIVPVNGRKGATNTNITVSYELTVP
jgi:thiol-disulfide isomerase/thioredoxin